MVFNPEMLKKLVDIFQGELEESTTILINGLVALEKSDAHSESRASDIEAVFRTAHNLKGAARGLGITTIGDIAHQIESIFSDIKSSNTPVPSQTIDICLEAVDKMQASMQVFINKTDIGFDIDDLKSRLEACISSSPKRSQSGAIVVDDVNSITVTRARDQVKYREKKDTIQHASLPKPPIEKIGSEERLPEKSVILTSAAGDSIRVSLNIIDKLSELSEEIQSNKIEMDDHATYAKRLSQQLRDFSHSLRDISNLLCEIDTGVVSDHLSKLLLRANDDIAEILSGLGRLSLDMSSQSNDYSRLSCAIHDEVTLLRLVPLNTYLAILPRYIRELSIELHKKVELVVIGGDVYLDKYVLEGLKDPINHLLRNAIDHGIEAPEQRIRAGKSETGKITITAKDAGNKIILEITDDGVGLDYDKIKSKIKSLHRDDAGHIDELGQAQIEDYIFHSGFSTRSEISNISGRGVGLDVVRKNVQELKGDVTLKSDAGNGMTFTIAVPLSVSSERGLVVRCDDQTFVLPTSSIARVKMIKQQEIVNLEGEHAILVNEHPVLLKSLAQVLQINESTFGESFPVVILNGNHTQIALATDQIMGEREIVIKSIQDPLANIGCVAGATLLDRNKIGIVLNPDELLKMSLNAIGNYIIPASNKKNKLVETRRILVVDDSITTRSLEKNILESKGFHVTTAVNGQEAWDLLQNQTFSLVITDINMPLMDGFALTEKIKQSDKLAALPVIIVTSLGSDAEKSRGIDVGADAYIVKNEFESGVLLQIINQLI